MHDLLRDMGREIIRNQSLKRPSIRSRLWRHEEVLDVITNLKATNAIEGISFYNNGPKLVHYDAKIFEAMPMLRLLKIKDVWITGSFEHIFQELRWLNWHGCNLWCLPSDFNFTNLVMLQMWCLPSDFNFTNLVMLQMQTSYIKILWRGSKHLPNLKILKLDFYTSLRETPDFTRIPNLEWLSLCQCFSLVKLHPSIGRLYKLHHLDLSKCSILESSILNCFDESSDTERSDLFIDIESEVYDELGHSIHNLKFLHFRSIEPDQAYADELMNMFFGS